MSEPSSGPDLFNELAQEFAERYRRGKRPALTEYTDKHPELAEQIRELFPALGMMEEFGSAPGQATGPFAAPADEKSKPPERLGDYRILREVAHSGMGMVYEAVQESLGRHVALKVLPFQGWLSPTHVERFQREARAAARLHHTNIVPVFGVGEDGGVHYYAMQFIHGQSLDSVLHEVRRLRSRGVAPACRALEGEPALAVSVARGLLTGQFAGPAPPSDAERPAPSAPPAGEKPAASPSGTVSDREGSVSTIVTQSDSQYFRSVAEMGVQAAEALAYAHQQGVLHRDIKPSNLLLDLQGVVWITDFGLAKAEGTEDLTRTGDIVGTLRYMAPERFEGRADKRGDVYSLGLTLYEMLSLQPAFAASERARLVDRILHEDPPRPRQLDPHIPRDLETIVLKAIAKEPALRYPSAAEMAEDLRRFLADRTILARRSTAWERTWRWSRRNPAIATLLVLVFVVLGTGLAFSLHFAFQADARAKDAVAAERKARLREAEALVGQARGIRLSRRPGQRFEALAALDKAAAIGRELNQPAEWFDRLRNEAIAALALPDVHITEEYPDAFPPGTVGVDLSEDFEWYARTSDQGGCTIHRVADGTDVARLPEELGEPAHAAFGPGRALAVRGVKSGRFRLWDLSGAEPALRFEESGVFGWYFRPDGRHLVLAHGDGTLDVYDVATGTRLSRLAPAGSVQWPWVLPHSTEPLLAVGSYHSALIEVRDWRTGAVVASATTPWRVNGTFAWSPDGRTLTVPDGNSGKIQKYAFDPAAPALRPTRLLEGPGGILPITPRVIGSSAAVGAASSGCLTQHPVTCCSQRTRCRPLQGCCASTPCTHSGIGGSSWGRRPLGGSCCASTARGGGWPARASGSGVTGSACGRSPMAASIEPWHMQGTASMRIAACSALRSIPPVGWPRSG